MKAGFAGFNPNSGVRAEHPLLPLKTPLLPRATQTHAHLEGAAYESSVSHTSPHS